ncbi:hypothetical protein KEM54_000971 [Ascosphaera aggregata]|nr:hypothetical protein KEM54_000971 [Ascosphaera aggregata]
MSYTPIKNEAAPNVPYFTPLQDPCAGTAANPQSDGKAPPKLFTPLKVRGLTFPNRIWYSADDGHMNDWHLVHLGSIATRGAGMTMTEAISVLPEGRISPQDVGLWKESQAAALKRVVDYVHSQNQIIGVQLAHAGRKASTNAPWLPHGLAPEEVGGWPNEIYAPSAIPFPGEGSPKEMTRQDIEKVKTAFGEAVKRAVSAGVDFIEIHGAHGYLLSTFMNPGSNTRTDEYGGSFENRIRLVLEVISIARANMPVTMPLLLRISGSDFMEYANQEHWGAEETKAFAKVLADKGEVDILDVSGGGVFAEAKFPPLTPAYQAKWAKAAKEAAGDKLLVTSVGRIYDGQIANDLLEKDGLDAIFVGRMFQKNPGFAWKMADDLGVEIKMAHQIGWPFTGRSSGPTAFIKPRKD